MHICTSIQYKGKLSHSRRRSWLVPLPLVLQRRAWVRLLGPAWVQQPLTTRDQPNNQRPTKPVHTQPQERHLCQH